MKPYYMQALTDGLNSLKDLFSAKEEEPLDQKRIFLAETIKRMRLIKFKQIVKVDPDLRKFFCSEEPLKQNDQVDSIC